MQEEAQYCYMMERYRHLHRIILMVVLQGGFPGSYSQDWAITLPESIRALRGSCVVIPCTFTRPRGNKDFSLVWYKEILLPDIKIFSQQDPSDVSEGYRRRTSLVGNEPNSCSLRINDVQESGSYYPYIHGNCHVTSACQTVRVTVSDVPNEPAIQIPTDLTEGERTPISCSVEHTCPPSPPTLQWNRAGYKLTERQQSLKDGVWKAETVMEYLPSYRDHGAELECEATYPNGLRSQRRVTINIRYSPKNVAVVISDGKKERKEGDAVSLTCASDANPAANAFTWYNNKRDGTVELREEQGRSITVTVGRGRETFSCTARNPLGTGNSTLSELQVLCKYYTSLWENYCFCYR
uniref:Ig-like domain-containing protein n=1 Tax=Xenopus tropicalis TaxID=8364 RepID=A0A6I8SKW7_XENTR